MSALPQSSPNAQGQAGPGEIGPACGEQTHALARTAAAKPGPAWPWALGELWGSALTVHCLLWGSFGVVGKLLGEPDFFGTAFSRPTAQVRAEGGNSQGVGIPGIAGPHPIFEATSRWRPVSPRL